MILGDYHTHTVYSHGKGTIDQNCARASGVGLKEIAITDHGFNHMAYGVRRKEFPAMQDDIAKARGKYPQLKVYLGLETNLLDYKGSIDLAAEDISRLDIIICGCHKFVRASSAASFWTFNLPVFMAGLLHTSGAKRTIANTDAFIKAMERYPIDIISHPGFGIKLDFKALAQAAAHFGTYLELNGKRIAFARDDAEVVLNEGAEFIVDSDAHSPCRVGDFSVPLKFVAEAGIPPESIANLGRTPKFRDRREA